MVNGKQIPNNLKTVISTVISIAIIAFIILILYIVFNIVPSSSITVSDITNLANQTILADNNSAQTLSQTPDASSLNATAKNNSWLSFDGVNDEVLLASFWSDGKANQNQSISFWINYTGETNDWAVKYFGGTNKYYFSNKESMQFVWENVSDDLNKISSGTINDSIWHFVTGNVNNDTANISLYIDGLIVNSTVIGELNRDGVSALILGEDIGNGLEGNLDELRVYNRTLTSTEITEIYNSGRVANSSLTTEGLILWLPLNENTGTDVHSFDESDFN